MTTEAQFQSIAASLTEYYGARYTRLSEPKRAALVADVLELMTELDSTSRHAVQELDRRIGNKLESYATTIAYHYGE